MKTYHLKLISTIIVFIGGLLTAFSSKALYMIISVIILFGIALYDIFIRKGDKVQ